MLRPDKRRDARDDRGGERSAGAFRVGLHRTRGERGGGDVDPRRGHVDPIAGVREPGGVAGGVGRANRDVGVRSRVRKHRRAVVPRRGDDDRPLLARVVDRVVEGDAAPRAAEGEVDHLRAVVGRPRDPVRDVEVAPGPGVIENLDRHDRRVPGDAGDADAVVRRRRCDAGDHCSVPLVVLRNRIVVDEVVAGEHARREVGMVEVDAGVDDRDLDRGRAPADVPGGGNPQRQQVLLFGRKSRIVRCRERVTDVVQLDGRDRRLVFERVPGACGVRHSNERERRPMDERPKGRAVPGQCGLALRERGPRFELDEQALGLEPLSTRRAAQRCGPRMRRRTIGRRRPTDDLKDQKSGGCESDRRQPDARPPQLRTPSLSVHTSRS